ncbi:MAG: DUF4878 domain-containing protein [Proteobacteria bacterium]|uniref:DUF4878 domain-containing protein n=1 Tax=Candidatus Avisuccinivibrio stercorigallinarum TaxID=2840704 RepID=A0A9D9GT20_9GAMM|nr:DUF4878 domain-containing protein [Candidatus Avisuccinivibrio stercorigallinarum]
MRFLKAALTALTLAAAALLFTGCGDDDAAAKAAVTYTQSALEGNTKGVMSVIYAGEVSESVKSQLEDKLSILIQAAAAEARAHGGLEKIAAGEVSFEGEDKNVALVPVDYTFKDGTERHDKVRLIKVNGDWKVKM